MPDPDALTDLLLAWGRGDADARSVLIGAVYDDLRRVARRRLSGLGPDDTLTPTALVHETYLKLIDQTRVDWRNRAQFFALAARLMQRVLIDHIRAGRAARRGGGNRLVRLDSDLLAPVASSAQPLDLDVLALHAALARLKEFGPRHSELVELRFFAGLSIEEAAEVLKVSSATAKRDWALARAWLYRELSGAPA
jgi:RNA polymerase sigma factor (TIGR02999 family)